MNEGFHWVLGKNGQFRCAEGVVYTEKATNPECQYLNIYAPEAYVNEDGTVNFSARCGKYTAKTAPVVFHNNAAGYMQMPPSSPDFMPGQIEPFLERGFVFISCGCRGRDSKGADGLANGKSPWTLVDIKTAIRFVRHFSVLLPGNFHRIISTGGSAGGAMSSLVGVSGDAPEYLPYLEQNGAFLDESDGVYAAQIYCPIINLEHADEAYEWQFRDDMEFEASPASPAGRLTDFTAALAQKLSASYVCYFNGRGLIHPVTGERLTLGSDGRSGSGYDYLLGLLEDSATKYLSLLQAGKLPVNFTVEDYLSGNYTYQVRRPMGPPPADGQPPKPPAPGGAPAPGGFAPPPMKLVTVEGTDKRQWLSWDGERASITSLDCYLAYHRRRSKPCTAFDALGCTSAENQEFGTAGTDKMHFSASIAPALEELKEQFPEQFRSYYPSYAQVASDTELAQRKALIDPFTFLKPGARGTAAQQFRIRVGSKDADTAFTISMELALRLHELGHPVDYALVWDEPHGDVDYPGEFCDWIEAVCAKRSQ
jgi:hypothetical protein